MPTPFQYLKQNVHKVKFDCDQKYIPEYKRAFVSVLDRLDKFFIENKLYSCGDYMSYVEAMIKPHSQFSFIVDKELIQRGCSGLLHRDLDGRRYIAIAPEYIGRGLEAEGVLCHELMHYLTIGPEKLKYEKDGKKVEVEFSLYENQSKKNVWEKGNTSLTPDSSYNLLSVEAMNGGFVCEAMTELTKQQIYAKNESYHSYRAQTEMIDFVSRMVGAEISIREFLQGDLQSFSSAMANAFDTFCRNCKTFQAKFDQNACIDYKQDKDYISIQDTFVKSYLTSIENQLSNPKYKPSNVAKILGTLYSAPVLGRPYDVAVSSVKAKLTLSQHLSKEQNAKFRRVLNKTISEIALHDSQTFALPKGAPNVILKQTNSGLSLNFNGSCYIPIENIPTKIGTKLVTSRTVGQDVIVTTFSLTEQGFYEVESRNRTTGESQIVNLKLDSENPSKILISDKEGGEKFKLDFETIQKTRERNIEENKNLLDNSKHFQAIQDIIKEMPAKRYCDVRKILSNEGQEYLIATSANKMMVVKVEDNDYKILDVKSESKLPETQVCEQVYTGPNKTGMVGYMSTKSTTDEDSIVYTLSDGSTFVKYWENGKLTYGEQISPFVNGVDTRIITTKNTILYSSSNKSLDDVFEKPTTAETSYQSQQIRYELPKEVLASKRKSQEEQQKQQEKLEREQEEKRRMLQEQQRRLEEEKIKQHEIERRREEEKRIREISENEIKSRNQIIEAERKARKQRELDNQQEYEALQERISKKQRIYDEYSVDITEIINKQQTQSENISYGRSR